MNADEEDGEVSDGEADANGGDATTDDEGDDDLELSDLDPNAEEAARQVERQLRRLQQETRR